jgi:cobyrinic acid a,c-diamide synthase
MAQNGVMIAGLTSGSGKTLLTLGLLRACAKRGLPVSAAKTGPDFIDAGFLTAAIGQPAVNLDGFAMSPQMLAQLATNQPGETVIVEAVMGLCDGAAGGVGSSVAVAAALNLPIILVLDVRHTAQTAAMLAAGLNKLLPKSPIAGVVLNRVASPRHHALISAALDDVQLPLLGALPSDETLQIPSRHLGLVQAGDLADCGQLDPVLDSAAEFVDAHCDIPAILHLAGALPPPAAPAACLLPPPAQNIAIAKDAAFGFCYAHMMQGWRQQGARITLFSPLNDEAPAADAEFVFIPGGYPELHLPALTQAQKCFSGLRRAAADGCLIYGECGGFMMLGTAITGADGNAYKMSGLLDLHTSFASPKRHLGYRRFTPKTKFFWPGTLLGHEFHFSSAVEQRGTALFDAEDAGGAALGEMGLLHDNVSGSYGHIIAMA